ncbi:MAG: hypothetical protein KBF13_02135 [Prevotella sp.]|nr:hypothetical protein [Prevotella sp.]
MLAPQKINNYLEQYQVDWVITMPENCPPADIEVPHRHAFFRLTYDANSISEEDLKCYAELDSQKDWGDQLPLAVGLSVLNDEAKAHKNLKLPYMREKHGIAKAVLQPTDGVVKQTGKHLSHYTWWRTASFSIHNIQMIQP